jgi:hypothetical protein
LWVFFKEPDPAGFKNLTPQVFFFSKNLTPQVALKISRDSAHGLFSFKIGNVGESSEAV